MGATNSIFFDRASNSGFFGGSVTKATKAAGSLDHLGSPTLLEMEAVVGKALRKLNRGAATKL